MKKQLLYIILLGIFSQGCEQCEEKKKIYRTVNKVIPASFVVNTTGNSTTTATISSLKLNEIFELDEDVRIEKVVVSGISLSGEINPQQNTATKAVMSVKVNSNISGTGSNTTSTQVLLNETNMIKVGEYDLGTDLIGTPQNGIIPTTTFNNAINSLNPAGFKIVQGFFAASVEANRLIGVYTLNLEAYTSVPDNKRLVGTVYLRLNASVTYYKCESMPKGLFNTDQDCY
ncbi:MAG: hypothetical protein U0Y10_07685 [Spirosomataceae bacterium]